MNKTIIDLNISPYSAVKPYANTDIVSSLFN